jgi:hypothetical protein
MVFMIFDKKRLETFRSDSAEKTQQIQDELNIHPAYTCEFLLSEDVELLLFNGCGDIKYIDSNDYQFLQFIKEE